MKKHKKHAKLVRAEGGKFHRIELGFLGAPCSVIQKLAAEITSRLNKSRNLAYVDAEHGAGDTQEQPYKTMMTDKISFHRLDTDSLSEDSMHFVFNKEDAVLVNGNHFKTDRQILIINESKRESLFRKLSRVNKVEMIILDEGVEDVFDFIKEHLGERSNVPIFQIYGIDKIANHISSILSASVSKPIGLIFAGGKSTRMGTDKGEIKYHTLKQREYLAKLAEPFCKEVFFSTRPGQNIDSEYTSLPDTFIGLGPYGGLLSAFQKFPNSAIFTLPVDVPFVDEELLRQLFENRNPRKFATCFHNPETDFPEPLITIWEPRAYPVLLNFLSKGYSCPRKVLINSEIEELSLKQPEKLFNANTPEERDFAMKKREAD